MKYLTLFFCLLAISFVTAEDRTHDPNDPNIESAINRIDSGDTWRVDLASQDILTNEDLNTDIKIEQNPQDNGDFDDYQDPDADLMDNDNDADTTQDSDLVLQDHDHKADGDFDSDLIRREILGEAHNNIDIKPEIDESDDDSDDIGYVMNDVDASEPERSVDSLDDDLRPDNGKISTQVSGNDYDEVEDSDDGDDGDLIDNTDSDDDAKVDLDYQQDDSGMADDDYMNEPKISDDNDYTMDGDVNDDSDSDEDNTDDFLSNSYLKSHINLQNMKLNLTTVEIGNDDDSNGDLNAIYYQTDDDDDSGDDDSDSDYDIYDTKYQEEPEKGGSDDPIDSSFDYDIFIDVDDSVWDSYLTDDSNDANNDDLN